MGVRMGGFGRAVAAVGVLAMAAVGLAGPARADSVETVAYEGFDYATGSLTGRDGGTGWSGAWTGGSPLQVSATGLTYTGLTVTGGTSSYLTFLNSSNQRCLSSAQTSGIVYLQFLSRFSANHGGGTPNIRLSSSGSVTGAIGNNNIAGNDTMAILDSGLGLLAGSGVPIAQLNFTIVQIDHDADTTKIWVNPTLATFDYLNPPAADGTATNFSPAFECIEPITRNSGEFDEITIKRVVKSSSGSSSTSVAAPAPQALSLGDGAANLCGMGSVSATPGSWVALPSADQCTVPPDRQGSSLLGWATTADFPVSIAQRQVDRGWGTYELTDDQGVITSIFIPAGASTRVTGSNELFPIWG